MEKQGKIKHHYLPEVYLKGFTSEDDDKLFVLRKSWGKISQKHPAQIMYKKHLYTVNSFSEPQMVEDFYQEVESELSEVFEIMAYLRNNPAEYVLLKNNIPFNQIVRAIIAFQFWRSPSQQPLATEMAEKLPSIFHSLPESVGASIELNSSDIDYFYRNRHDEAHQRLIQNMVLPLLTFRIYDDTLIDFNLFVPDEDGEHVLTCDNPVVYHSLAKLFNFESFAFPLTKNIIIGSNSLKKGFTVDWFNKQIVMQANERVVGAVKGDLEYAKEWCCISSNK